MRDYPATDTVPGALSDSCTGLPCTVPSGGWSRMPRAVPDTGCNTPGGVPGSVPVILRSEGQARALSGMPERSGG